ncbi:MAG: ATP-binding protein [archaeon YNP-LCB-003-016]|uniref:AAA family ATPase n=1 Tax=Candidatus Culexarchaeum yellowstonense TaxID=2928963 RepID=UPI0026EBA67B|nr:ATP-binding protein [Candidatus Culexarchaeum yellowstonense]MCR6693235.1 ATP-binding protein [Candidatus Culexarchaeum yellowstonense]
MLFSVRPKEKREELYDFDKELEELKESIKRNPITVLVGTRRTGRTSLLNVALNELGNPYIYLDLRMFVLSYETFMDGMKRSLEDFIKRYAPLRKRIAKVLQSVRGLSVSLSPISVNINLKGEKKLDLAELFTALNKIASEFGKEVIVAIDEAQELRKIKRINFLQLLAYIYDNLENIRIVLTGSGVTLLSFMELMQFNNVDSPLNGRYIHIISIRNLSFEESVDFLERGFREIGVSIPSHVIKSAARAFGGTIGWLTLFGYNCYMNPSLREEHAEKLLEETVRIAVETTEQEIRHLLNVSEIYRTLLKILTTERSFSEIKKILEDAEGKTIRDTRLSDCLYKLIDLSVIQKREDKYVITDHPIIKKAVEELLGEIDNAKNK